MSLENLLLISSQRVVLPDEEIPRAASILISSQSGFILDVKLHKHVLESDYMQRCEKIFKELQEIYPEETIQHIDYQNKVISPGLIDSCVHIQSEEWEGVRRTSLAAISGGVTTILEMPILGEPYILDAESLKERQEQALEMGLYTDLGFAGGVRINMNSTPLRKLSSCLQPTTPIKTPNSAKLSYFSLTELGKKVREMVQGGVLAIRLYVGEDVFSEFAALDFDRLSHVLNLCYGIQLNIPLLIHCEKAHTRMLFARTPFRKQKLGARLIIDPSKKLPNVSQFGGAFPDDVEGGSLAEVLSDSESSESESESTPESAPESQPIPESHEMDKNKDIQTPGEAATGISTSITTDELFKSVSKKYEKDQQISSAKEKRDNHELEFMKSGSDMLKCEIKQMQGDIQMLSRADLLGYHYAGEEVAKFPSTSPTKTPTIITTEEQVISPLGNTIEVGNIAQELNNEVKHKDEAKVKVEEEEIKIKVKEEEKSPEDIRLNDPCENTNEIHKNPHLPSKKSVQIEIPSRKIMGRSMSPIRPFLNLSPITSKVENKTEEGKFKFEITLTKTENTDIQSGKEPDKNHLTLKKVTEGLYSKSQNNTPESAKLESPNSRAAKKSFMEARLERIQQQKLKEGSTTDWKVTESMNALLQMKVQTLTSRPSPLSGLGSSGMTTAHSNNTVSSTRSTTGFFPATSSVPVSIKDRITSGALPGDTQGISIYTFYLAQSPMKWEENAILQLIDILKDNKHPKIHITGISSSKVLSLLDSNMELQHREDSGKVTWESAPHYLFFSESDILEGKTKFKCNPPIRGMENKKFLLRALAYDMIHSLSSHHFPMISDYKVKDFQRALSGATTLGFTLQSLWTIYRANRSIFNQILKEKEQSSKRKKSNIGVAYIMEKKDKSEEEVVEEETDSCFIVKMSKWLSERPAKLLNIYNIKGSIFKGKRADLVIWDTNYNYQVTKEQIYSRVPAHCLYYKQILQAEVNVTYLSGRKVFQRNMREEMGQDGKGVFFGPYGRIIGNNL